MPFIRPTFGDLLGQVQQDIRSAGLKYLPKSVLGVLGRAIAGVSYTHTQYLDWISKQSTVFTAESEYLEAWGALKGLFRKPASASSGTVSFTGVTGTLIPALTKIARTDGVIYSTQSNYTIGTTASVQVLCDTPGVTGNLASGTLTIVTAIAGVSQTVTLIGSMAGGADAELDDALRTRTLYEYARRAAGGSESDIDAWALSVPGVTRAWSRGSGAGPGTVVVYPMLDTSESSYNGFPQGTNGGSNSEKRWPAATGDQLVIANALYDLRPTTMIVVVTAPIQQIVNITISGLTVSSTVQTQIRESLAGLFAAIGTPLGGTISQSQLVVAIQGVVGTASFSITSPQGSVSTQLGSLPVIGTINYQ